LLRQAEEARAIVSLIGTDASENADGVMQRMGADANRGTVPIHHFVVHPDLQGGDDGHGDSSGTFLCPKNALAFRLVNVFSPLSLFSILLILSNKVVNISDSRGNHRLTGPVTP
jgi:hypothetical protein